MVSSNLFWLLSAAAATNHLVVIGVLWTCAEVEACFQLLNVLQPIHRCNRFGHQRRCSRHSSTVLSSQGDTIIYDESDASLEHTTSRYRQRVAVLLPSSSFDADDDGDTDWQHEEAIQHLRQVARKSNLSIMSLDDHQFNDMSSYTHLLTAVPCPSTNTYAIAIHANPPLSKKKPREKKQMKLKLDPFFVDLCPSSDTRLGYRMNLTSNKSGGGNELLLKALGIKKMLSSDDKQQLVIYDLTAGLARDSLIMLSSVISDVEGSTIPPAIQLHMVERDPLVALLLQDAMRRLDILDSNGSNIAKLLTKCLSMEKGDALSVLERLADAKSTKSVPPYPPDIVYLDPMFPPRKKKASAVKKDMAMLHSLLETATMSEDKERHEEAEKARLDEEQKLLEAACHAATRRVVVKRPANALPLGLGDTESDDANIPVPSFDIRGNINRWDVYIRY